ncbi:hypothetical protein BUALT_Bualt07G0053900 [Buddleja alternifolia]|uniref:EF-hand domain-containing protein n=1 Tax=Buddleja alternifolia TaxID=168488 RepID=A0AAV6X874_9LAMI|nr:hypothetical protein BUALT_Bualt07G0053900 [Buddleja alternifolia]
MEGVSDDELLCMLKEGYLDGDGCLNQMEFCVLMFRLSPDLMNQAATPLSNHGLKEDVSRHPMELRRILRWIASSFINCGGYNLPDLKRRVRGSHDIEGLYLGELKSWDICLHTQEFCGQRDIGLELYVICHFKNEEEFASRA